VARQVFRIEPQGMVELSGSSFGVAGLYVGGGQRQTGSVVFGVGGEGQLKELDCFLPLAGSLGTRRANNEQARTSHQLPELLHQRVVEFDIRATLQGKMATCLFDLTALSIGKSQLIMSCRRLRLSSKSFLEMDDGAWKVFA
jgi:hypothetical protein